MITRATLPSEFIDLTSASMLVEPEPQYLYATLFTLALMASFTPAARLGITPDRAISGGGASVPEFQSNQLMLEDPIYTDTIVNVPEIGARPGHTVRLNRPFFANTTYTEDSRTIVSGKSISKAGIEIANSQVAITLKRYGGPYDPSINDVGPYSLERFDANLALHDLVKLVGNHMKRDYWKATDTFIANLLDTLPTLYPDGITQDNDIVATGAAPMSFDVISKVEQSLDDLSIPQFPNGNRVLVCAPKALRDLKNDPQFARYAEFHPPKNPLLAKSYYRTVGNMDIFKSVTIPTATNSSSVKVYKNQAFGPGVIGSGLGRMPGVAFSTDDNYGEQAKVIWLMYAAFRLLDNRFGFSVHTG